MHGFHHLRFRMRSGHEPEPFPAQTAFKRRLDYVMYGVGVFAPLALLPQIIEIYSTKSSAGVSLTTWLLLMGVNVLWMTYGAAHKDNHILLANGLFLCFHVVIVAGLILY